jgi:tetratricopeptide (TPR) repeat protein
MGYNCSAAVNLKIDGIESQELNAQLKEVLTATLEYLSNNAVNLKKDYDVCLFFDIVERYSSLSEDIKMVSQDHKLIGSIIPYKGAYKLDNYLFDFDHYITEPEEVLQLLVFCFYLSKKIPTAKIFIGLGDVGFFWLNLELKDGEITDINFESENNYDEESWGFICNVLEMRQFFLGQNCLWMEINKVEASLIKEYYDKNNQMLYYLAIENDPVLMYFADDSIKNDREFVMKILKVNGNVLDYVDESFRSDREVALIALKSCPYAYTWVSEELKNDREFVMLALEHEDYTKYFADIVKKFPCDRTIVLKALVMDPYAYEFICPELKKDAEIIEIVNDQDPDILKDAENNNTAYVKKLQKEGLLWKSIGEYDKALEYYLKCLDIQLKTLGAEHTDVATTYNNIGGVWHSKCEYDKALEYYEKSLEIKLKALGAEHPSVATSYNNIGGVWQSKGEYDKALEYYLKCLDIRLKTLGAEHTDVATSCDSIGGVWHSKGEYDKALVYYEKSLDIILKTLGAEHPYVALTYFNMAICLELLGRKDEALNYFMESAEIRKKRIGLEKESTIDAIQNVKRLATELGKENELPDWMRECD